jgi:TetR/AcrR family transcriptional repressor of mexJK operon
VATELFLTEGYGSTTIEAVAQGAGISKRTFYHRFEDKSALFAAVVHRIIQDIRPPADVPLIQGATLRENLRHLAQLILRAALAPRALALHRLVTGESARFPSLMRAVYDEGTEQEAVDLISALLLGGLQGTSLTDAQSTFAAQQFIQMVVVLPQRRAMGLGAPMTAKQLTAWAHDAVDLLLEGCQGLKAAGSQSPTLKS